MADDKENDPSSLDGPAAGASTTSATDDLKKPKSTMTMQNSLNSLARDGLDDVVMGGCSTCGSLQHNTVKCDRQDVPSAYMMSGALQTDEGSSASVPTAASVTDTPDEKPGQDQPDMPLGQDTGRRRSV